MMAWTSNLILFIIGTSGSMELGSSIWMPSSSIPINTCTAQLSQCQSRVLRRLASGWVSDVIICGSSPALPQACLHRDQNVSRRRLASPQQYADPQRADFEVCTSCTACRHNRQGRLFRLKEACFRCRPPYSWQEDRPHAIRKIG